MNGAELAKKFYHEAVAPILKRNYPAVKYSAGLVGPGSEVLGFDDTTSQDHDFGPRCFIFVADDDDGDCVDATCCSIHECLSKKLPLEIAGFSTNWGEPDPNDNGTRHLVAVDHNNTSARGDDDDDNDDEKGKPPEVSSSPAAGTAAVVSHRVVVTTWAKYTKGYTGFDLSSPTNSPSSSSSSSHRQNQSLLSSSLVNWLVIPMQKLRTLTAQPLFHDDLGLTETAIATLKQYPDDIRRVALAAFWRRVTQEEHLMGRCGKMRGDELGASLIAGRLARNAVMMAFLLEREYAPYAKWFGTAFQRLQCAPALAAHLQKLVSATDAKKREEAHVEVFRILVKMHQDEYSSLFLSSSAAGSNSNNNNRKNGDEAAAAAVSCPPPPPFPTEPHSFFGRPILVWASGDLVGSARPNFEQMLLDAVEDEELRSHWISSRQSNSQNNSWFGPLEAITDDTDCACDVGFSLMIRRGF